MVPRWRYLLQTKGPCGTLWYLVVACSTVWYLQVPVWRFVLCGTVAVPLWRCLWGLVVALWSSGRCILHTVEPCGTALVLLAVLCTGAVPFWDARRALRYLLSHCGTVVGGRECGTVWWCGLPCRTAVAVLVVPWHLSRRCCAGASWCLLVLCGTGGVLAIACGTCLWYLLVLWYLLGVPASGTAAVLPVNLL
jgi:hypothetical protein